MAPSNSLTIYGNEKTMNLNPLILTNIQSSPYFKVNLFELKTYHEVIDEIYYKVNHLEPWEKGSRKTAGQTGMCGGVRGVGAGGIVSSAYCLLYKLFTLKLTRKQVTGLITHTDSPYIRGLGFMYIRYTQPPQDFWEWYEPYLEDEEEIDVKAGGGHVMVMGEMLRQWITKLEWYSTLFPRIPVPAQKKLEVCLRERDAQQSQITRTQPAEEEAELPPNQDDLGFGEAERLSQLRLKSNSQDPASGQERKRFSRPSPPFDIAKEIEKDRDQHHRRDKPRSRSRDHDHQQRRSHTHSSVSYHHKDHRAVSKDKNKERKRSRSRDRYRSRSRDRHRSRSRDRHSSRSRDRHGSRSRDRPRSRSKDRHRSDDKDHRRSPSDGHKRHKHRSTSKDRGRYSGRETSFERDLRRERERHEKKRRKHDD